MWNNFDQHFETVSRYGYGIKAYIEIAFLEKNVNNLKISKEKIGQYLTEFTPENQYLKAANDNFSLTEKQYLEITAQIVKIKSLYDRSAIGSLNQTQANSIRFEIDSCLSKSQLLISNYRQLLLTIMPK